MLWKFLHKYCFECHHSLYAFNYRLVCTDSTVPFDKSNSLTNVLQMETTVSMASVSIVTARVPECALKERDSREPSLCGCLRNYSCDCGNIRGVGRTERL